MRRSEISAVASVPLNVYLVENPSFGRRGTGSCFYVATAFFLILLVRLFLIGPLMA